MRPVTTTVCAACLFAALPAGGAIHVVDVNGGYDFVAIGPALEAAAEGDTILVHPGLYTGPSNRGMIISGDNLVLRSTSGALDTMIDCEGAGRALFVSGAAVDSSTVIRGFTFTHGWARAVTEDGAGAILCSGAAPIIENCVFAENEGNFAGAVKLLYGDAIVRSCEFIGNDAVCGGALHSAYCSPRIVGCTFFGNTSTEYGGAFRAFRGDTIFRNCTFAQNASAYGGCVHFDSSPVNGTLERCIFAFSSQGTAVSGGGTTTAHSIVFGNAAGDSLVGAHHDNHFGDPLFCGLGAGDLTLCANSWGLSANNTWGLDVGSQPQGCPDCDAPVTGASWGAIKALYR